MRKRVGVDRTVLCATRLWSIDKAPGATTSTLLRGVRSVVRRQGYTGSEVTAALKRLERGGFIRLTGSRMGKGIALTAKGGRVTCSTVSLAPWTDAGYPGAALAGYRRR